jgi:1,4-alpha-glucan branching enzyme
VRTLNRLYREEPALWERDFDWTGFRWIDPNDVDNSVLSFVRIPAPGNREIACVANLTPVVRENYRIGLPRSGRWVEILNTDSPAFGGSGVFSGASGGLVTEPIPWNDLECSARLTLPPLAVLWLAHA